MQGSPAKRNPRDYKVETWAVVLVAAVVWSIGAFVVWERIARANAVQSWASTQCEVVASATHVELASRESGRSGGCCRSDRTVIEIAYRFRAAGNRYGGNRYNFRGNKVDGPVPASGDVVPCYYDPGDPNESVIDRRSPVGMVDYGVLAGCLLLAVMLGIRVVNALRYPPVPRAVAPSAPPPTHETREQMVIRVLEHLARSPLASFPLAGGATRARVATVHEPLSSPVTSTSCVAYELTVLQRRDGDWVPLLADDRCADFTITDDTGSARVEGRGADLALDQPKHVDVDEPRAAPANLAAVLARCALADSGPVRFTECVLRVGDEIALCGVAGREPDPAAAAEGGYREAPATRLVLRRGRDVPLAISNHPAALASSGKQLSPQLGPRD